jgi:hypothetical protein
MWFVMEAEPTTPEERAERERKQLKARGMHVLTGGLTSEADTFLIAVGAAVLFAALYPIIGGWALLAFPLVVVAAVALRAHARRRRS